MKTLKKGTEVKRLTDEQAAIAVKSGWAYCPKSEFKKANKTAKSNP